MQIQPIVNTSIHHLNQMRRETYLDAGPFKRQSFLEDFIVNFPYGLNTMFPPALQSIDILA